MFLKNAKLCLDCERIFSGGTVCPGCGSNIVEWVHVWLPSLKCLKDDRENWTRNNDDIHDLPDPWYWAVNDYLCNLPGRFVNKMRHRFGSNHRTGYCRY